MAIKLQLDKGFQKMISDLELSQKDTQRVASSCINQSAQIMQADLKAEMQGSDLSQSLANKMPSFQVKESDGKFRAEVGFPKTSYSPRNLSDYHKAVFANYGTPHRKSHGQEKARGFVQRAKKSARPKIKKQQNLALKKILERL